MPLRLIGRALAQHQAVRIAGSSLPLHPWDLPHSPKAFKTDQLRRTGHAQTRRWPRKHTEPNGFAWLEGCAHNKYTDKNAKRNQHISEHCDNTTGTWRMRWEMTSRLDAPRNLFHLVAARRIHKIRKVISTRMIGYPRHARKECCNFWCRHPF